MSDQRNVVEVGDSDFEFEVIAFSNEIPVVVDFWAEWCAPCKILGPTLEKLAEEGNGAFRLAKVDVDSNPMITMQYQVQSIPAVKAFHKGRIVAEFVGARGEPEVRDFLRNLAPSAGDLAAEKARSLLSSGDWAQAGKVFGQVLKSKPDDAASLLGLAKSYIAQGESSKALAILNAFPASKETKAAEQLIPIADALAQKRDNSAANDHEAAYLKALQLVRIGNVPAAIDGLLDLMRNGQFSKEELKNLIVGLLHLLGEENPQSREYRNELSSLLF